MKRPLALVLILGTLLLCGCVSGTQSTTPSQLELIMPSQSTTAPTTPTTTPSQPDIPTEPTPTAPTEPELVFTNPLTGEVIDAPAVYRPFCVVFNNSEAAMPQHGTSQADIFFETLIEGETRCMGVFYDITKATEPFGAIRSARRDFIRLAMGFDGIFVHGGMSPAGAEYSAEDYFALTGWDHIDGVHGPDAEEGYFYRTRADQGYAYHHTLFINPDKVVAYADRMNCRLTRDLPLDLGWQFDDEAFVVGQNAEKITAWFNMSQTHSAQWHKSTTMNYNKTTGLYEAYQYGQQNIDGNTGRVLSFRNVLILRTNTQELSNQLMKIDVVGSGTGFFAVNGQIVPILWSRSSEAEPYVFTTENGSPITLGVGKTYIAVIPNNGHVEYQ